MLFLFWTPPSSLLQCILGNVTVNYSSVCDNLAVSTGYSAWRELCGLSVPVNESDLAGIVGNKVLAKKLLRLYGTARNMDVWVGSISETAVPGGRVGPLLTCLIAKQFKALRDGDR